MCDIVKSLNQRKGRLGFTLIEVVIAMGIFAILASGILATTLLVRKTSEDNLYRNTGLTIAQGYLEQLRSIDYTQLKQVAQNTSGIALNLLDTNGGTLLDDAGNALSNGDWTEETLMLDETSDGKPIQPMTFRFQILLTYLGSVTGGLAEGIEITINYKVIYNFGTAREYQSSLKTVRSDVPTY